MPLSERRRREIDDLAGGEAIRQPRVDLSLLPPPRDEEGNSIDLSARSVYKVKQGVPIRWLAHVFGMTENTVKRRIKDLRPVDIGAHGNPLYSVPEAAAYLVEPKVDLRELIRDLKDDDLPDDLRLKLWQARRARNKVLEEEGEYWHSALVLADFAEVLLGLREKLQLIPEHIERLSGITAEQYKLVRSVVDAVQDDMHKTVLEMAARNRTPSVLGQNESDEVSL